MPQKICGVWRSALISQFIEVRWPLRGPATRGYHALSGADVTAF
jgi:hypothetical protein